MEKIIKNCVKCKVCGDLIESTSEHDFKTCSCGLCSVDGGREYLKRGFSDKCDYEELSIVEGY